jgi:hypothetical protein
MIGNFLVKSKDIKKLTLLNPIGCRQGLIKNQESNHPDDQ